MYILELLFLFLVSEVIGIILIDLCVRAWESLDHRLSPLISSDGFDFFVTHFCATLEYSLYSETSVMTKNKLESHLLKYASYKKEIWKGREGFFTSSRPFI